MDNIPIKQSLVSYTEPLKFLVYKQDLDFYGPFKTIFDTLKNAANYYGVDNCEIEDEGMYETPSFVLKCHRYETEEEVEERLKKYKEFQSEKRKEQREKRKIKEEKERKEFERLKKKYG